MGDKSYIGKGRVYIKEVGAALGTLSFGNCDALSFAINEDKKEQKDYQDQGGGTVNTVSIIDSVVGTLSALELTKETLSIALRGLVNTNASAAVVAESHIGYLGGFIKFNNIPRSSIAISVTNTGASTTYAVGTDFELANTGIKILATGTMVDAAEVLISYTSEDSHDIQGITDSVKEYELTFDGLNEADSGKPVAVVCHKVKFSPTSALELIGSDFAKLPFNFDVLKDSTKVGAGESKYFYIEQVA
jgi:hypothetical protein